MTQEKHGFGLNSKGNRRGVHPNSLRNLKSAPGVSGNPAGRKPKADCLLSCIKEELAKPNPLQPNLTNEQLIASMLVSQATKGNIKAIDLMMSYLHAKPTQHVGLEGPDGQPISSFVFLLPDGSRVTPQELVRGNSNKA